MENVNDIINAAVEPEQIGFDALEIIGLIVPLLFAIMTIVLVAMNPDPSAAVAKEPDVQSERLEQIHRR